MTLRRRLDALERRAALRQIVEPATPHPMPDLTGHPVEEIVDALIGAIVEAHRDDGPADDGAAPSLCASCIAVIDLASHYGDPTHLAWPDPVSRYLADAIDAELAARKA